MIVDFEHHYIPAELGRRLGMDPTRKEAVKTRDATVHAQLFDPPRQSHCPISLSAKAHAGAFESRGISDPCEHHLASNPRVESLVDQVAGTHLDVEGDLVIHFLIERYAP